MKRFFILVLTLITLGAGNCAFAESCDNPNSKLMEPILDLTPSHSCLKRCLNSSYRTTLYEDISQSPSKQCSKGYFTSIDQECCCYDEAKYWIAKLDSIL